MILNVATWFGIPVPAIIVVLIICTFPFWFWLFGKEDGCQHTNFEKMIHYFSKQKIKYDE